MAIDDHPEHLQSYQGVGARVFVMDQPWNRQVVDPNVIRVSGWDSLLQWWHFRHIGAWPNRLNETPAPHRLWKRLPTPA